MHKIASASDILNQHQNKNDNITYKHKRILITDSQNHNPSLNQIIKPNLVQSDYDLIMSSKNPPQDKPTNSMSDDLLKSKKKK